MKLILLLALFAVSTLCIKTSPPPAYEEEQISMVSENPPFIVGAYEPVPKTELINYVRHPAIQRAVRVCGNGNGYKYKLHSLETQVVAGTNYKISVRGHNKSNYSDIYGFDVEAFQNIDDSVDVRREDCMIFMS